MAEKAAYSGLTPPVRSGGNVTGTVTWSSVGGSVINFTATGDATFTGPSGGADGRSMRMMVTASGGDRTIAFSKTGTVPIWPLARLPVSYLVPSGLVLVAELLYSTAAGGWLLVSADVEGADTGQYSCSGPGSSAQSIAANTGGIYVAWPTDESTTALVTKAASGAGHVFTLNRAGLWSISHFLLFTGSTAGHKRTLLQVVAGTGPSATTTFINGGTATLAAASTGAPPGSSSIITRFRAGVQLAVVAYSNQADSITANSGFLSINYLGP